MLIPRKHLRLILAALEARGKALEPFGRVALLMAPLAEAEPERWPDDKPNHSFTPGRWPTWGDFRRALIALGGTADV